MIVCTSCKKEMRCVKTGLVAVWNSSHCYAGDEFECPQCNSKTLVISGESYFDPKILDNPLIDTVDMDSE